MKIYNLFFILSIVFTLLINSSYTLELQSEEGSNKDNIICEKKDQSEIFYDVYVEYPKGKFDEDDPEYINYLNNLLDQIYYIIAKNRKNYQNPKELDRLQENYEKRKSTFLVNYGKYGTVYRIYELEDIGSIVLSAYLNDKNIEEVRNIPDIVAVERPIYFEPSGGKNNKNEEEEIICFEKDDTPDDAPIKFPLEEKEKKLVCEPRVESEGLYNVIVKYHYDEKFSIDDPDFIYNLKDYMRIIDVAIITNISSYQDRESVNQLHKQFNKEFFKDNMETDYKNSGLVKVISFNENDGTIVLSAYLNTKSIKELKIRSYFTSFEKQDEPKDEYCHEVDIDTLEDTTTTEAIATTAAASITTIATSTTVASQEAQCFSVNLDHSYPCCSKGAKVVYTDSDGEWGYENNTWCGITNSTPDDQCFSISLGYPCCSQGAKVYYTDNSGEWGYENNNWCGISN